ncbi:aminoacyl-tRNA hydrolase [Geobacter sp. AOG1]|uniref:aminoacyl-tRNA hydrolase n=1 Tax=Geobacter sp. AOG1 TaxID=1566346 RepID=UPI001CC74026|nr:aminoacyl-tRNA hydrolase [Geobacter sp. AOG1]GFE56383.1 peptidyl-tRNA hydrolase [Geobacter sp. AOG1]
MAKLIVGLGNPGPKYQGTRHNAGFMVLDCLAREAGIQITRKAFGGFYGEGSFQGERLLLLKPQTFMNLSGRSVSAALRFHKLAPSDLVVIHDDLDIPFGRVKLKDGGGHGGHNGLRSLMQELGGGQFVRVRIGVGRPVHGDAADYVLTNFSHEEQNGLDRLLDGVVSLLAMLMREGLPKTMSLCNNRDFREGP